MRSARVVAVALIAVALLAWPSVVRSQQAPASCEDQLQILARYAGGVKRQLGAGREREDQYEMKLAELTKRISDLEAQAAAANKAPAEKDKGETK